MFAAEDRQCADTVIVRVAHATLAGVRPGGQVYIKCTSPGFAPLSTLSPNNPSHHRKMHPEVIGNLLVTPGVRSDARGQRRQGSSLALTYSLFYSSFNQGYCIAKHALPYLQSRMERCCGQPTSKKIILQAEQGVASLYQQNHLNSMVSVLS